MFIVVKPLSNASDHLLLLRYFDVPTKGDKVFISTCFPHLAGHNKHDSQLHREKSKTPQQVVFRGIDIIIILVENGRCLLEMVGNLEKVVVKIQMKCFVRGLLNVS